MKVVEIECRKFDEWDAKTQEKILNKQRDINVDHYDWHEPEIEYWAEKLMEMGYDVYEDTINRNGKKYRKINIAFSGFWSQGDGASYTGEIDISKWIKTQAPVKYARIKKLIDSGGIEVSRAEITRHSSHYVHERSTTVYIDWNTGDSGAKEYLRIQEAMSNLEREITQHHIELNKEIYSNLEKLYDSLVGDEAVKDTLMANEYELDSNGKIW